MTIKDIAKLAGVSPATVSKIINNKAESISEDTRKRVLDIIEQNAYVPYSGVRDKIVALNNTLAIVSPSIQDVFSLDFIRATQALAEQKGYVVSSYFSNSRTELETSILNEINEQHPAGLILIKCSHNINRQITGEFKIHNIALIDCPYEQTRFAQFYRDYKGAAKDGVLRLFRNNLRRVALALEPPCDGLIHSLITSGFQDAFASVGHICNPNNIITFDESFSARMQALIDSGIDSIICQSSQLVQTVYHIIYEKHYRVPEDISLLCLEDTSAMEQSIPPITAAHTDVTALSKTVLDTLFRQMDSGSSSFFTSIQPYSFVDRHSIQTHPESPRKIVIAGNINMDITLKMQKLPRAGETILASSSSIWPGGKGANQAVGVSRFGCDAYMLGKVGNDIYGKQLFESLTNSNINMKGVSFSGSQPSGVAYIHVQSDGQNSIVVNSGANATLTQKAVEKNLDILSGAQLCLIQLEIPFATVEYIIAQCNLRNIKVILKPSPVRHIPSSILQGLYMLVPNEEEIGELVKGAGSIEEKASSLVSRGVQNVIVTLGDKGCIHVTNESTKKYDAQPYPCVDATGASDVFISCLAAGLVRGDDMQHSIEMATLAASYSVSKEGVQNGILDLHTLKELYNNIHCKSVF